MSLKHVQDPACQAKKKSFLYRVVTGNKRWTYFKIAKYEKVSSYPSHPSTSFSRVKRVLDGEWFPATSETSKKSFMVRCYKEVKLSISCAITRNQSEYTTFGVQKISLSTMKWKVHYISATHNRTFRSLSNPTFSAITKIQSNNVAFGVLKIIKSYWGIIAHSESCPKMLVGSELRTATPFCFFFWTCALSIMTCFLQ